MTRLLYDTDSHLYEFEAVVEDIVEKNGFFGVILDQTAFFPEGGGQKADTGFIKENKVTDVQTFDETVIHYVKSVNGITVGEKVFCRLDRELRFHRMQAHSGEHIVSGLAHNLYGAENVGFHMDGLLMTVDFDIPLSKQQLFEVEQKANDCVYRNLPVKVYYPTQEELNSLSYRSKLENLKNTRIVEIKGVDACACCAPHVSFTGEIGCIKILSAVSHRGGVRITLLCGMAAYEDYAGKNAVLQECAELLKVRPTEASEALRALFDKNTELKNELNMQKEKLCRLLIGALPCSQDNILYFTEDFSVSELAVFCKYGVQKTDKLFIAFSGSDETGYAYAMVCKNTVLKPFAKVFNEALNGRGGGRDYLLQGTFMATKQQIIEYFNRFEG